MSGDPGRSQGAVPHARLADFAPALLGRAHSHDQVPEVRLGRDAHAKLPVLLPEN